MWGGPEGLSPHLPSPLSTAPWEIAQSTGTEAQRRHGGDPQQAAPHHNQPLASPATSVNEGDETALPLPTHMHTTSPVCGPAPGTEPALHLLWLALGHPPPPAAPARGEAQRQSTLPFLDPALSRQDQRKPRLPAADGTGEGAGRGLGPLPHSQGLRPSELQSPPPPADGCLLAPIAGLRGRGSAHESISIPV